MITNPMPSYMLEKLSKLPAYIQAKFDTSLTKDDKIMMLSVDREGPANLILLNWETILSTNSKLNRFQMDKVSQSKSIQPILETMFTAMMDEELTNTQERIENLVKFHLSGQPLAEVDRDIERDNAKLRAEYLKTEPCYKTQDLIELSHSSSTNKSDLISKWKSRRRVFAVRYDGMDFYPKFQFKDGEPVKVIKSVLNELPRDMSPWQIAFWFQSGNGWLDGEAPQNCLHHRSDLMVAASMEGNLAVG